MKLLVVLVFAVAAVAGDDASIPDSIDWRTLGAVTPPIDMRDDPRTGCANAVAGALEGLNFIETDNLVPLSGQKLRDCVLCDTCGIPDLFWISAAFQYVVDNGINTEASYPYQAQEGDCLYDPDVIVTATNFTKLPSGDEDALKQAVAAGPVVASIDGSSFSFQHYSGGGIYDETNCSSESLDLAVLIVGYGTTPEGIDYWLVKNSWGEEWGDGGYIQMSRNRNNQCGIATDAYQVK